MNKFGLEFHHIGLATDNFELTLKILKKLGYKTKSIKFNKNYNVKNAICISKTHPTIEIVSKKSGKSVIDNILKKNKQLVYHICYICDNFKECYKKFKKNNIEIIKISKSYISPFEKVDSSFFYINGIGIIEIFDRKIK